LTSNPPVDIYLRFNKGIIPFFCFLGTFGFSDTTPWIYTMDENKSRILTIVNDLGLHARSAAKLAKLAEGAGNGVWIMKNGMTADATSMLDIMALDCPKGSQVTVSIDDEADLEILERIADLIRSGFGEAS
jgi:phosphocarrier protein